MDSTTNNNGSRQCNMQKSKCDAVLLLSGGIDSTTVLEQLTKQGKKVFCLIFDYKQTLSKEIAYAAQNAKRLKQPYKIISIDLGFAGSKCSLISKTKISVNRDFKQIDSSIPTSYVEFRNGILLSYAVMFAEVNGIGEIYGGFNGLASGQYHDDTLPFIKAFEKAANLGTSPAFNVRIRAPFSMMEKAEIVKAGRKIGIDYEKNTWSCYNNGDRHCGKCDSCKQRERALKLGG